MDPRAGRFVVMGVSGSGKSLIGSTLAGRLGGTFIDGDDLHAPEARAKMAAGHPLSDEDRWPWLDRVAAALEAAPAPAVVACSALRRAYRDRLRGGAPGAVMLHLAGEPRLVAERLQGRRGHFMPQALLQSQFDTLEPLGPDEAAVQVDVRGTPEAIVDALLAGIERL